jgi:ubiquinone/menaquinone biosynthesis C-methylase UbiE
LLRRPDRELSGEIYWGENGQWLEVLKRYFSAEVARGLPQGRLGLFDLQAGMVDSARRRLGAVRRTGRQRVDFTQGDARRLPFGIATFVVFFLVAVLGEVLDSAASLRET